MLCEKCKNKKSTVFFTDAGGANHSLCAYCASSFNHAQPITDERVPEVIFSPESLIVSNVSLKLPLPAEIGSVCDICKSSGEIGCISCAEKRLKDSVNRSHRMPRRIRIEKERLQNIAELKKRLDKSLSHEDYEGAASLRDQIRKLQAAK